MLFHGKDYGNDTIDVINKNCFSQYDILACLRSVLLTTTASITIVFIICKIYKYHIFKHKQIQHYAIFYINATELLVCVSSFLTGHIYPQLKFSVNFLKLLKLSIICQLHWSSSARAHNKENIIQQAINPGLCLYMIYCTTVALMGMVDIGTTWNECLKPYWLMLSVADFVAVQCFAVAAVYITHKTNWLPILETFKQAQKRDLMTVVVAYELSSFFTVSFDVLMRIVGTEEKGCSAIFGYSQFFYSVTEFVYNVAKYLLPTWAILIVFQPVEDNSIMSDTAISTGQSIDGTLTSNCRSVRGFHQYHRMCVPSSVQAPDNFRPSHYLYPSPIESPPSPSNSNSSVVSGHQVEPICYTNRISLNCNQVENQPYEGKFMQRGLTTISEESNVNVIDSVERV
ncbi:hypothetical protein RUM43_006698 [Polyplax serrata]|uniref:Uncharacterized protein n=1 Tax=Polyplax serrata TaxID=468196 RepID=A0AAN8NSH1_POLSC